MDEPEDESPTGPPAAGPESPTPKPRWSRRRKIITWCAGVLALLVVGAAILAVLVVAKLNRNITTEDVVPKLGTSRPQNEAGHDGGQPIDVLVIGSDQRNGANAQYGTDFGARSDTTILVHVSSDRKWATAVSIPRDTMVQVPACVQNDGTMSQPYFGMFNSAFDTGGAACTMKTVEQLTGVRLEHFVEVDFTGFKHLIDAIGGVPICLDTPLFDTLAKLNLPAGCQTIDGEQSLAFVRARHGIGDGSDLQRIGRQQTFLKDLVTTVADQSLLQNPLKLYDILDAATSAITTDPGLGSVAKLYNLSQEISGLKPSAITFVTAPNEQYPPDPNRVQLKMPDASQLFSTLVQDVPYVNPAASSGPSPGSTIQ